MILDEIDEILDHLFIRSLGGILSLRRDRRRRTSKYRRDLNILFLTSIFNRYPKISSLDESSLEDKHLKEKRKNINMYTID